MSLSKWPPGGHNGFFGTWWHGFRCITRVCLGISIWIFICMLFVAMGQASWFSVMSYSKWSPGGHIWFSCFRTLTSVWLLILSPNFSTTLLVYMEWSLFICSDLIFKMAARRPYWIFQFPDSNFSLALNSKSKLLSDITCVYGVKYGVKYIDFQRCHLQNGHPVAILDFSVSGILTLVWLWMSSPNFSSKLLVYMRRSLLIFSNIRFKMAAW